MRIGAHGVADHAGTDGWIGKIDEVMIFNYAISAEQVKALHENRTDMIVSQETAKGDRASRIRKRTSLLVGLRRAL